MALVSMDGDAIYALSITRVNTYILLLSHHATLLVAPPLLRAYRL